ncbi:DMT family transporter [Novosphingobium mangrovi (ex Hu et al. 2023)]|uniref:DMT family transporter n=1 Tax=Novosphingobium mangrovi (ex Hu et al. 2023) TaxID=2930094 RepID=A0ABT0ADQ3_9SPHN|nr:DMT family transporter [Novosphingobium mangrovi (ex Hu et al. 2023)]MCJ1961325.1 DMT family transporter [Novosphingobium mangrovi (ex Hu et al. 2023)]MED5543654.1 DMT family transporter [Pseudomonadota bacterium]
MNEDSLLRPAVALPFLLVSLIWGSTWWVITGQIDAAPAGWSVAWRFLLATPAMFVVAAAMKRPLRIGRAGHVLAMLVGITQFCGNYNFVYSAEMYLTSGIVAVMIALMLVPNALLARVLLGQPITQRFLIGSGIAIAGIGLLLLHEAREAPLAGSVWLGVVLALAAMLCASVSNVIQANETGRKLAMVSLLAWAMLYGTLADIAVAWLRDGPPVIPTAPRYWLGTAYLAVFGSVVTFPLYYTLIRKLGAGRAAYNGVAVVVIAMLLSTVFEGYRWSLLAGTGAGLATLGLIVALSARKPAT